MKHIEIFTNSKRVDKTTDISKIVPFEFVDSIENTVLDPQIQNNGGEFELNKPIYDSYGREIHRLTIPPIKAMVEEKCWVLDNIQMRFNTLMKVHDDYINQRCEYVRVQNAAKSYLERGLAESIWGKDGSFRSICISHRSPHSVRAVALPNADYGIDEVGIPKSVMAASDRKHGDPILVTRFPAIWDGSIEVFKARASNNDCIELHPLLHSQFNLDHDGDTLTGYWVPDEEDCLQEAADNLISFFKESENSWPTELCMNGYPKKEYDPSDIESLKTETKQRLIPDGFSIDPVALLDQTHDLDEVTGKGYAEDISAICKGISKKDFYTRSIDINVKNLTMKMFMGPVGVVSNDVKLVGSDGPEHVRRSAMYISQAIQQSLMDSKHEVGSPNNMRFMKIRNAIAGNQHYKRDAKKIIECIEENGMDASKAEPFVMYMYVFKPLQDALIHIIRTFKVDTKTATLLLTKYKTLLNKDVTIAENYVDMLKSFRNLITEHTRCSSTVFEETFKAKVMSLNDYILGNFPVYALCSKTGVNQDTKSVNDLCARVIVDKEVDLYGCCADEFAKFGD